MASNSTATTYPQATLLLPHTVYKDSSEKETDCQKKSFFPKALYAWRCLSDIYTEVHQPTESLTAYYCTLVAKLSITVQQQ